MKTPLLACLSLACFAWADLAAEPEPAGTATLTRDEIETLVGPIALYPDALVALILPAATRTTDIVLAARFLNQGGNAAAIEAQPWDESVRALARYPEVIKYLDENLAWTQRLGECFVAQPVEVMDAIQAVRRQARQRGLLSSTDEQTVIVEEREIRIVPTRETIIYVPRYHADYLYASSYWPVGPFVTFGIGYSIGSWLSYDCDWRHHRVRVVHRSPEWAHRPDWRKRPEYRSDDREGHWRDWKPDRPHPRTRTHIATNPPPLGHRTPSYAGAPSQPRYDRRPDARRPDHASPQPRPRLQNRDDDKRRPHGPRDRTPATASPPQPATTFAAPAPVAAIGPTSGNLTLSTPTTPPPFRPAVTENRSHRTRPEPPAPRHRENANRSDSPREQRDDAKPGQPNSRQAE